MRPLFIIFLVVLFPLLSLAQNTSTLSPIIFIYDGSGSMWGQLDGSTKMEIAVDVLSSSIDALPEDQPLGLVVYGHRHKGDCKDVEFVVPTGTNTKTVIKQSLKEIKPLGKTPLAHTAGLVINELKEKQSKATVILVTDGIESCGGNLCKVIKDAKDAGIDFRLHIVGFGLKTEETESLKCAADAGDGKYFDASDAEGLTDGLEEATNTTVDEPVGNYSIFTIKNQAPVDAYVEAFAPGSTTSITAGRTYGDTLFIYLPEGTYDLKVRPLENSDVGEILIENIISEPEKTGHQTVSFDAGKIQIVTTNNNVGWDATLNVEEFSTGKRVGGGRTYGREKIIEVTPGRYTVEMKALDIKGEDIVFVSDPIQVLGQQTIQLNHDFKSGKILVGAKSGGELVDATINFFSESISRSIASGRTYTSSNSNPREFILTPGIYKVKLNALKDHKGKKAEATIEIESGKTIEKIFEF